MILTRMRTTSDALTIVTSTCAVGECELGVKGVERVLHDPDAVAAEPYN